MTAAIEILKRINLKVTQPRLLVLEILDQNNHAVSQPFLEKILLKQVDRVTLYRVLSIFEQKGVVHKIIGHKGTINYALCTNCTHEHHNDQHLHFNCIKCDKIFCLAVNVPTVEMPLGYQIHSFNHLAQGICQSCSA